MNYSNNNQWKYNQRRSLFTTDDKYKLPSFQWQKDVELVNSFNNNLVKGFSQGLSILSPEQDLKLFNNLNLDAISTDNVNFDKVNAITQEGYNKNDDIYNNTKSVISGVIDQINKSTNDIFNIDSTNLKIYAGLIIFFMILNK